jgi:NAD(P)-dependent dehydrogenase (short-subunit alcohol dehydrogenase family)
MSTPGSVSPFDTNVTRTVHRTSYSSIDPTRPELSHAGKTVLITGGTTGIGFDVAKAFIAASASTVIITGRRQQQLDKAVAALNEAVTNGKAANSQIIGEKSDAANTADTNALWASLADKGITVDILVLNAAKFATPKPLLELGIDHVWNTFEVNVRTPLHFTEKFYKQPGAEDKPKVPLSLYPLLSGKTSPERG